MAEEVRLQKFIADCGICSRRKAEELIVRGYVKVDGKTAQIGEKVIPGKSYVEYLGKEVVAPDHDQKRYIMLNKPRGYISTLQDEQGRKCVKELIADIPERLVPVGRLDRNSEGLLLMTNDGDLVYTLTHPKHSISKYYVVTIEGKVSDEQVERLNGPIEIDGYVTSSSTVFVLDREPGRAVLRFELREGRNRQIRKMCEAVDLKIIRLKRFAVGKIKLSEIKAGKWRDLTPEEVRYLKSLNED